MSDYLNRPAMVRTVIQAQLDPMERRVLCACIGLADCDGHLDLDITLLAPMSGVRYRYLGPALKQLAETGWLESTDDGPAVRLTGPLTRHLTVPPP